MNGLGGVIAASVGAGLALFCGLWLYRIKSDFATFMRRYGSVLGILFIIVAVINFLLNAVSKLLTDKNLAGLVSIGLGAGLLILLALHAARRALCLRKMGRKGKKWLILIGITFLDIIEDVLCGIAVGLCFTINFGAGMMSLSSIFLLLLVAKYRRIEMLCDAKYSKRTAIILSLVSSVLFLAAIIVSFLISHSHYVHLGVILAIAIGFLLAQAVSHLVAIVKEVEK